MLKEKTIIKDNSIYTKGKVNKTDKLLQIGDLVEATDFYGDVHKGQIEKIKTQEGRQKHLDTTYYYLKGIKGFRFKKEVIKKLDNKE